MNYYTNFCIIMLLRGAVMIQILKIEASGFRMLDDNFTINFVTEARINSDDADALSEVFEVDKNLYAHRLIALTGRNAAGKTTTLRLIRKVISFMKTGRWLFNVDDFSDKEIKLKINFYKDGVIYIYMCNIIKNANNDFMIIGSPYCDITNESLLFARYKDYAGKRYETKLKYFVDDTPSTGLIDTGKIVFLCSQDLNAYNMSFYSSGHSFINESFFNYFNMFDFNVTSSIIRLLDESIEYIKYNSKDNVVRFKRFNESETKTSKEGVLSKLSNGTIKGIELYANVINVLKTGGILLIDEIENCFHKNLVNNIFFLIEDRKINKKNSMIIFTTHYFEILDAFNRRDSIFILHKKDNKISISNLYSDYNVRTELLKSKQFNNNTFDTLLNYDILMDVRRGILNEISNHD